MSDTIKDLNLRYGASDRIAFREGKGGFINAVLACSFGTCEVSLYGGHVLSYRPTGHGPVLFVSASSEFVRGKPIRGGIPVCWPWFGKRAEGGPTHGFARISDWTVVATSYTSDYTELTLGLKDSPETRALWPHTFELRLDIRLGDSLRLMLTSGNTDKETVRLSQAFHPYFRVMRIEDVEVDGLDGAACDDRVTGEKSMQRGPLSIGCEVDRIYHPSANGATIHDKALGRNITETFKGTKTLVVWNPWIAKSRAMADFGDDEYKSMLCVEPVCTADTSFTLEPGKTQSLTMNIQALIS
jgi:glucose-6-phosphate 1-epimerase